jgi:hypothetical protein
VLSRQDLREEMVLISYRSKIEERK